MGQEGVLVLTLRLMKDDNSCKGMRYIYIYTYKYRVIYTKASPIVQSNIGSPNPG